MSEVKETMEDFASELEASYKEYDARRNNAYQDQEGPDAEKWAELAQQMEDKTVLKVKVKEAVKGGLVAYVDDIQGFIPASQAADHYIEKLEDLVGQHLETNDLPGRIVHGHLIQLPIASHDHILPHHQRAC